MPRKPRVRRGKHGGALQRAPPRKLARTWNFPRDPDAEGGGQPLTRPPGHQPTPDRRIARALARQKREKAAWQALRSETARVRESVKAYLETQPGAHGPPDAPNGRVDEFDQTAACIDSDADITL